MESGSTEERILKFLYFLIGKIPTNMRLIIDDIAHCIVL